MSNQFKKLAEEQDDNIQEQERLETPKESAKEGSATIFFKNSISFLIKNCILWLQYFHTLFMNKTSTQYDKVIVTCKELFIKKMKDYGTAWRVLRTSSVTDQLFIKQHKHSISSASLLQFINKI